MKKRRSCMVSTEATASNGRKPGALSRREFMLLSAAAAGSALLPGCGGGDDGSVPGLVDGFFFGRTAFDNDVIGLAVNSGNIQVLVTDAQPDGDAEWFEGRIGGLT